MFLLVGWLFLGSWYSPQQLEQIRAAYGDYIETELLALQNGEQKSFKQTVVVAANNTEVKGKILLKLPKYPKIKQGQVIKVAGKLSEPKVFPDFNYKEFLRSRNIHYTLDPIQVENLDEISSNQGLIMEFKNKLLQLIKKKQSEPQSALLSGLLLGTRENFSEELENNFRKTGTTHIVAVSGYNVTIVILLVLMLSGLFPRRFLYIFLAIALAIFITLIGWYNLPARRAVLMGYVLLTSWLLGRPSVLPMGLLYATVFMFLQNPLVWKDVSFQLSLTAILGLLLASQQLSELFSFLPKLVHENFVPTAAVLAATLPVSIATFGSVSLVALPVNILVLPLVPMASAVGALGVLLSFVPILGDIVNWFAWLLLGLITGVVNIFAQFQFASTDVQVIGWLMVILLVVLTVLGNLLQFRRRLFNLKKGLC